MAGGFVEAKAVPAGDFLDGLGDGFPQGLHRPGRSLLQERFLLAVGHLDRVVVRGVGRQIAQLGTAALDRGAYGCRIVGRQIVHDDDVAE